MVIYLALLILPALVTGLFLLHIGKKEDNKTKRTAGLILLILGILIAVFCAAIFFLLLRCANSVSPSL